MALFMRVQFTAGSCPKHPSCNPGYLVHGIDVAEAGPADWSTEVIEQNPNGAIRKVE